MILLLPEPIKSPYVIVRVRKISSKEYENKTTNGGNIHDNCPCKMCTTTNRLRKNGEI